MYSQERIESYFFKVLDLLGDNLRHIVVVGGWLPYLYSKYLWQAVPVGIPTTMDIDLGIEEVHARCGEMTLYQRLLECGLSKAPIYEKEVYPIDFILKEKGIELKIEIITSFEVSDDTLNRFVGKELACHRIEAFELLLDNTIKLQVDYKNKRYELNVPRPAIFLFHKGITFVTREADWKRDKDLFYVYYVLKFHPKREKLIEELGALKKTEYFEAFADNLREYVKDMSSAGYLMLRPFIEKMGITKDINEEISLTFKELLHIL